jgi:hypothetical protein
MFIGKVLVAAGTTAFCTFYMIYSDDYKTKLFSVVLPAVVRALTPAPAPGHARANRSV